MLPWLSPEAHVSTLRFSLSPGLDWGNVIWTLGRANHQHICNGGITVFVLVSVCTPTSEAHWLRRHQSGKRAVAVVEPCSKYSEPHRDGFQTGEKSGTTALNLVMHKAMSSPLTSLHYSKHKCMLSYIKLCLTSVKVQSLEIKPGNTITTKGKWDTQSSVKKRKSL